MTRYRISVGRNDGVRPGNIVGAVANEAGIDGGEIGHIKIYGSFSTIDLPNGLPVDAIQTLQKTRVVGKQLRLKIDEGNPSSRSNYRGSRGGRSNDRNQPRSHRGKSGKSFGGKRKRR